MGKYLYIFFLVINVTTLSARCSEVPAAIKNAYASNMHHAFVLQSLGKSTAAYAQFQSAYEEAKKAGESIKRLIAVEQLFIWYRMYGSSLNLFSEKPTGNDRIVGEYRPKLKSSNTHAPFKSEWGKTPEQAAQMREFMLGVAEIISGIFCAVIGTGFGIPVAYVTLGDGAFRMFSALNNIWAGHQAILALRNWEQTSLKAAEKE
ncbi:MAG TPA: hypothetical protein VLF94_02530 [Chlamydiales bacterium]|nr:hypothetical protein [Chlamydiales bacterium]